MTTMEAKPAATSGTEPLAEQGIMALTFARGVLLKLLDSIPADKVTAQPIPACNHALWVAGHVADTDDFFVRTLTGKPSALPAGWKEKFGGGSAPSPDPKAYPPLAEVKRVLADRRDALIAYFRSLDRGALLTPTPEKVKFFGPTVGSLAGSIAWHEGLHAGQVTMVRKGLGMPPLFG
ncbi:MAG: DinB family protein [Phycisphaerales bacterium]